MPILRALYGLDDGGSAGQQLCQLARWSAEAGDEAFRTRLYEIVEQKPVADCPWLGESEIVALDGEQGFLFAARVRGIRLAGGDWDDGALTDLAVERWGEEHAGRLLEASSDEGVSRFRDCWRQNERRRAEQRHPGSHQERMIAIPVEEVIRAAEGLQFFGAECPSARAAVSPDRASEGDASRVRGRPVH